MKTIVLPVISFFICFNLLKAQTIEDFTKDLIKVNEVSSYVGVLKEESEIYLKYRDFLKVGKTDEFLKLLQHPHPVVKTYAGWALIDSKYPRVSEIYSQFIDNDTLVNTFHGCTKRPELLSREFYDYYLGNLPDSLRHTDASLLALDSVTIFKNHPEWVMHLNAFAIQPGIIAKRVYPRTFHPRIEYLAFELDNDNALLYFSYWYKAEYKERLKNAMIEYLEKYDFSKDKGEIGSYIYYTILKELLTIMDVDIRERILLKLRADESWREDEKNFLDLLHEHNIWAFQ